MALQKAEAIIHSNPRAVPLQHALLATRLEAPQGHQASNGQRGYAPANPNPARVDASQYLDRRESEAFEWRIEALNAEVLSAEAKARLSSAGFNEDVKPVDPRSLHSHVNLGGSGVEKVISRVQKFAAQRNADTKRQMIAQIVRVIRDTMQRAPTKTRAHIVPVHVIMEALQHDLEQESQNPKYTSIKDFESYCVETALNFISIANDGKFVRYDDTPSGNARDSALEGFVRSYGKHPDMSPEEAANAYLATCGETTLKVLKSNGISTAETLLLETRAAWTRAYVLVRVLRDTNADQSSTASQIKRNKMPAKMYPAGLDSVSKKLLVTLALLKTDPCDGHRQDAERWVADHLRQHAERERDARERAERERAERERAERERAERVERQRAERERAERAERERAERERAERERAERVERQRAERERAERERQLRHESFESRLGAIAREFSRTGRLPVSGLYDEELSWVLGQKERDVQMSAKIYFLATGRGASRSDDSGRPGFFSACGGVVTYIPASAPSGKTQPSTTPKFYKGGQFIPGHAHEAYPTGRAPAGGVWI